MAILFQRRGGFHELSWVQLISGRNGLLGLGLCGLLASFGNSVATVSLPQIAETFGATFGAVQAILLGYLVASTCFVVVAGRLGDSMGRGRLLQLGIGLFVVASLACGLSPTLWLLVIARVLQGMGAAAMSVLSIALVADQVPLERTGKALGMIGAMSAVGTALGPAVGGWLFDVFGWRSLFLLTGLLGLLALALVHALVRSQSSDSRQPSASLDWPGVLFLVATLTGYSTAMTLGDGRLGEWNWMVGVGTVLVGGLFVMTQSRSTQPLVRLQVLADPELRGNLILSSLVSMVMMTTLIVGPIYLGRALGLTASWSGWVLSIGPVLVALIGVPVGRWVDRSDARRVAQWGLGVMTVGATGFSLLSHERQVLGYLASSVVLTLGYGVFQTANNAATITGASSRERGMVAGLMNLFRNLGFITGTGLMGSVFTWGMGSVDAPSADAEGVALGMELTFAVAALIILVGMGWRLRLQSSAR